MDMEEGATGYRGESRLPRMEVCQFSHCLATSTVTHDFAHTPKAEVEYGRTNQWIVNIIDSSFHISQS